VFDSSREGRSIPVLDAVAGRSRDGRKVFVKAVNTDHVRALAVEVQVDGTRAGLRAETATITASSPGAFKSFATPDAVAIRRSSVESGVTTSVTLPHASVMVLVIGTRDGSG
jgi:alpha-L-arabinofuranosidase